MFALAILVGIYSYVIFCLGIMGFLYKIPVIVVSLAFIIGSIAYFKKHKDDLPVFNFRNRKFKPLFFIFGLLAFINLIGALGPELSFDALWYHLTIPKIFIENQSVFFIKGNLFYYSLMPKLGEMLYIPALMFGNETIPKLIQWLFGILTSVVVYKISRKYFDEKVSFFGVLIFYSSLVVAWESSVAYIDLIRTFFEAMGLWGFLNWYETRDRKWLIESAVMIGFAISSKTLGFGSLMIFMFLIPIVRENKLILIKNMLIFSLIAIFTALPWYIFSFIQSGNLVYPFFDKRIIYDTTIGLSIFSLPRDIFTLFANLADPITPIYLILLPLVFIYFKKLDFGLKLIGIYSALAILVWLITPRTGGGRFILPYLPAFSVLSIALITQVKNINLRSYLFALIIVICFITIFYRGIANLRFVPVILGIESKKEFLSNNLNFKFGDFYDTDGYFKDNISKDDMVLMYGFHNIYYADFPFIHQSYAKKGDQFNYIAVQDSNLPERFSHWNLIYSNEVTGVRVYSFGGQKWSY